MKTECCSQKPLARRLKESWSIYVVFGLLFLPISHSLGAGGYDIPSVGFVFVEQRPTFTSEDKTARSANIYIGEQGLVQKYFREDYQLKQINESFLDTADVFKSLPGISLKAISNNMADAMSPPSQAHPACTRIIIRQPAGGEYQWQGPDNMIPPVLKKIVQEATALAEKTKPAAPAVHAFVRADILSAEQLAEYRVAKTLRSVNNLDELDPILNEALLHPFRLIAVPGGGNPLSVFSIKGEANHVPFFYNETGYEIIRYSY